MTIACRSNKRDWIPQNLMRHCGGSLKDKRLQRIAKPLIVVLVFLALFGGFGAIWIQPTSASLGSWAATTNYPTGVDGQSCVTSSGFVYCIGGFGPTTGATSSVYFASLSSSGVGSWSATTNYPTTIREQSCVASSGFIYCIGGYGITSAGTGNVPTNAVYFAPLSSNGVGCWSATTTYPANAFLDGSCVVAFDAVYYVGNQSSSAVTFASLSWIGGRAWS